MFGRNEWLTKCDIMHVAHYKLTTLLNVNSIIKTSILQLKQNRRILKPSEISKFVHIYVM